MTLPGTAAVQILKVPWWLEVKRTETGLALSPRNYGTFRGVLRFRASGAIRQASVASRVRATRAGAWVGALRAAAGVVLGCLIAIAVWVIAVVPAGVNALNEMERRTLYPPIDVYPSNVEGFLIGMYRADGLGLGLTLMTYILFGAIVAGLVGGLLGGKRLALRSIGAGLIVSLLSATVWHEVLGTGTNWELAGLLIGATLCSATWGALVGGRWLAVRSGWAGLLVTAWLFIGLFFLPEDADPSLVFAVAAMIWAAKTGACLGPLPGRES